MPRSASATSRRSSRSVFDNSRCQSCVGAVLITFSLPEFLSTAFADFASTDTPRSRDRMNFCWYLKAGRLRRESSCGCDNTKRRGRCGPKSGPWHCVPATRRGTKDDASGRCLRAGGGIRRPQTAPVGHQSCGELLRAKSFWDVALVGSHHERRGG